MAEIVAVLAGVAILSIVVARRRGRRLCAAGSHRPTRCWREGLSDDYERTRSWYRCVAVQVEQSWTECARCGELLDEPTVEEVDGYNSISQPSSSARRMRKYGVRWDRGQVDGPKAWGVTLGFAPAAAPTFRSE